MVKKLASKVGKTKLSQSIPCTKSNSYFVGGKTIAYNIDKDMLKYNITLDPELEPEELKPKELEAYPIEVLVLTSSKQGANHLKKTNRAEARLLQVQEF